MGIYLFEEKEYQNNSLKFSKLFKVTKCNLFKKNLFV